MTSSINRCTRSSTVWQRGVREGTHGYQQTMPLLAEDISEVMFYTKEQEDSESLVFSCSDKYYHDEKYFELPRCLNTYRHLCER
jgi:hypothetical protein